MRFARDPKTRLLVPQRDICAIPGLSETGLQWFAEGGGNIFGPINAETGDLSQFTGTTKDGTITAFDAHADALCHGSYGFRIIFDGAGNDAFGSKTIDESTELYCRAYVKFGAAFTGSFGSTAYLIRFTDGGTVKAGFIVTRRTGGAGNCDNWGVFATGAVTAYSTTNFSLNAWHYIELYWKSGEAGGHVTAWVDGDQIFDDADTTDAAIDSVSVGFVQGGFAPAATETLYFDDILCSTGAIGAYSEAEGSPVVIMNQLQRRRN